MTSDLPRRVAVLESARRAREFSHPLRDQLAATLAARPDGAELGEQLAGLIAGIEAGAASVAAATLEQLRVLASLRLADDPAPL